jgi:hypothetical protein
VDFEIFMGGLKSFTSSLSSSQSNESHRSSAMQPQFEKEVRLKVLAELLDEVEAAIRQHRRTLEGLQQRIDLEIRQREMLIQKRNAVATERDSERTIAEYVAKVLYERGEPMQLREIVKTLEEYGVSSDAENGPLNSVMTALTRRRDLFRRVARGYYALKEASEERNRTAHSQPELVTAKS